MPRMIDADKLKAELHKANNRWWTPKMAEHEYDLMLFIDAMPTVDAVPVWVSVKDRLPESCGNYLVRVGKDGFNPQTKTAYWLAVKKIWKGVEAYSTITDVSHWMPLPEPPKERDTE